MSPPRDVPFDAPDQQQRSCPICRKPPAEAFAPFCSKRCADVDLHRWLRGVYAVPSDETDDPDPSSGDDT